MQQIPHAQHTVAAFEKSKLWGLCTLLVLFLKYIYIPQLLTISTFDSTKPSLMKSLYPNFRP